ncbi:unnamed protein product [Lymnaea stagnalis]|uniref:Uncharacterized protein n=1 Tax=Lymnaea stagnalis TaxID=6523 RepID=A0AAV2IAH5_LYMST
MIHDINGNVSTHVATKTLRRKPRPLSIIDESSTAENDVNNTNVQKIDSQSVKTGRSSRRLAVAPLQHPVIELSLSGYVDATTENPQSKPADVTETQNIRNSEVEDHENWNSSSDHGLGILNWSVPDKSHKIHQYAAPDPDDGQYLVPNGPEESEIVSSENSRPFCERLTGHSKAATADDNRESTSFSETGNKSPSYDLNSELSAMKKCRQLLFPISESKNVCNLDGIGEEEQWSNKRDLDKDQTAWRERVKESASVSSLPDKFRPLRKSLGSFGSGSFNPRNDVNAKRGIGPSESSSPENVRFYLPGQRNSPEYLINPNSVVTRHPSQLKDCQEPMKLKDVVQRKSSWQGSYDSSAHNKKAIDAMRQEFLSRFTSVQPVVQIDQIPESEPTANLSHQDLPEIQTGGPESIRLAPLSENIQGIQPATRRISSIDQPDYFALKETTNRLRLSTRRASTLAWKAQYADHADGDQDRIRSLLSKHSCSQDDGPLTKERIDSVEQSLAMLRHELMNIRHQDQDLAKQFLEIRHDMGKVRWAAQCKTHDELLDEAEEEIQDYRDMSRLVDLPSPTVDLISSVTFLQHFGVTRMNISSRRFSTC